MIQSVISPAIAGALRNAGLQGMAGEDRENSADFAALLDADPAARAEPATIPAAAMAAGAIAALPTAGKTTGKTLPPDLPEAEAGDEGNEDGATPTSAEAAVLALIGLGAEAASPAPPADSGRTSEDPGRQSRAGTRAAVAQPATMSSPAPQAVLEGAVALQQQAQKAQPAPAASPTPAAQAQAAHAHAAQQPQAAASGDGAEAIPPAAATPAPADAIASLPDAPIAAELQPVMAIREAQAAPVAAPQAAPAAVPQPSTHDFAALVDRLVEAREAAAPQAVSAAVRHAEFGQVSLRFLQDDSGMTVAMSSTDPGFAPAVQAAAPSAQTGSAAGDSAAPRQEAAPQQGAAFAQPQTSGQSRGGHADQTVATTTRGAGRAAEQPQDDESPAQRGGIYA